MSQPTCPHAARCPGCTRLEQPYEQQLSARAERLRRALSYFPALQALEVPPLAAAPTQLAFRTRAKLVAQSTPAGNALGLFDRDGGHRVVDVPGCLVLAPAVAEAVAAVRSYWKDPKRPFWLAPAEAGGALLGVDAREVLPPGGEAAALLTLLLDRHRAPEEPALREAARTLRARCPALRAVAVALHDPRSPQLLGGTPRVLDGEAPAPDAVLGEVYTLAAPGSFAQAHRGAAGAVYTRVAEQLARALGGLAGRDVVDAFAGSGALGLVLASRGARVTLLESFEPSLEAAQQAARAQRLEVRGELGDAREALQRRAARPGSVDAVALDPPRRGLSPELRRALYDLAPRAIAYVSCEPATLARDLAHLAALGWRVDSLAPFDLMPHTDEVETVALLRPCPLPAFPELGRAEGLLALALPGYLEERGEVLPRVRVLSGFERAEPLEAMPPGASGAQLFLSAPEHRARLQAAVAGGEVHWLALCRGITHEKGSLRTGGGEAPRLRYRRLAVLHKHSLLHLRAEGGTSAQLPRFLSSLGHPVLGDELYGDPRSNRYFLERYGLDRPFLHAARRSAQDKTGTLAHYDAPLAGELRLVLAALGYAEDPTPRATRSA